MFRINTTQHFLVLGFRTLIPQPIITGCSGLGTLWAPAQSFPESTPGKIVVGYSNGTWVALDVNNPVATYVSADSHNWTTSNAIPFTGGSSAITTNAIGGATGNSTFFVMAGTDTNLVPTNNPSVIWWSIDGDTWTESAAPSNAPLNSDYAATPESVNYMPFTNTWVVGLGGVSSVSTYYALQSTDGKNWTFVNVQFT